MLAGQTRAFALNSMVSNLVQLIVMNLCLTTEGVTQSHDTFVKRPLIRRTSPQHGLPAVQNSNTIHAGESLTPDGHINDHMNFTAPGPASNPPSIPNALRRILTFVPSKDSYSVVSTHDKHITVPNPVIDSYSIGFAVSSVLLLVSVSVLLLRCSFVDTPKVFQKTDRALLWFLDSAVFILYVILYLGCAILGHATRSETYSSAVLVFATQPVKLLMALFMWRICDGSFKALSLTMREEWQTLAHYIVPSFCYSISDTLRTHVLRIIDPSAYLVLFNLRMFFLAYLWERFLNCHLRMVHWCALTCILVGCAIKELPGLSTHQTDPLRFIAYGEILLAGCIGALASVYQEWTLKAKPQAPVSLQCVAMYTFGCFWSFCMVLTPYSVAMNLDDTVLDIESLRAVFVHTDLLALNLTVSALGVTTAYFLKRFSNIHREVAIAVSLVCSLPLDMLSFGYTVGRVELLGIAAVLLGIILLAKHPWASEAKPIDQKLGY